MDLGHQLTDEELAKLERKIAKVYKTAADEMQDKITEYFKKFDEQDKKKRALLEQGKITEQEYKQWRLGKLVTGKKYQSMRDQLAERMTNANQEAVAYVNSSTPTVYSLNRNYTAYQIEQADINASFQLWDENTVARLIKDNPELMPNYPKEKALARGIDLDWGKKQISKEITTGILLGESNQSIAKRLLTELPDMNKASAIRTARTATTSAECAGRQDTYESAKAMGIVLKKRWLCTHDARTREEHLAADGQSVDVDKPFEVGGEKLMNPGDTSGSAWNIMNCRCTTVADIDTKASAKNKNPVSFNKWVEEKRDIEPSEVRKSFEIDKVEYNPVTRRKTELSIDEIVKNIGGGDETKGSCVSLGLCYIGNRSGLDVLDFRGGRSLSLFSQIGNIKGIANLPNVKSTIINGSNDFKTVTELLKKVEPDKEYFLSIGQHAAIIRKIKDESDKYIYQYLELQSPKNNGYFRLTNDILKNRFGCKKSHSLYGQKIELPGILIDSESLYNNSEFEKILGYLNTKSDMQQKGAHGKIK